MKRIALLLAATAFSAPAFAADVIYDEPAAPVVLAPVESGWTGLYLGLQGGGAFNPSSPDRQGIFTSFGDTVANFPAGSISGAFGNNFDSSFDSGFVGGAHVGYDVQFDRFVVGGILDINATDIAMSQSSFSNTPAFYTIERDLDYVATARLRAGYLITPTVLAYATGGAAYGEVGYSFTTDSPAATPANPAVVFKDEDHWGYSVGGGMELKITENLSFGTEYLYTNMGGGDSVTRLNGGPFDGNAAPGVTVDGEFTDFTSPGDFDFHTITAKLSYRFN
ncbi:outer membrane protein [Aureimonas populi]|uniref:Outer membrane protein n=1 Tax=Aureimonas populi TaxID=1701758 RepID=A0ABW5CGK3_9HYPH|nr:outer membrane beta-barrel protein [Aureimonas populi]